MILHPLKNIINNDLFQLFDQFLTYDFLVTKTKDKKITNIRKQDYNFHIK